MGKLANVSQSDGMVVIVLHAQLAEGVISGFVKMQ
jgi:hypothetical protein